MRRFPTILLTSGIGLLVTGSLFLILTLRTEPPNASAALPEDHPDISGLTAVSGSSAHLPTTKADFFTPGSQPNPDMTDITNPQLCSHCHSSYSFDVPQPEEYEPWTGWQGSMMAQAGRDPIFYAALDIAGADANLGGEFCLRCHLPRAWLEGRIVDGALEADPENSVDLEGVQCEVCHRLVDPTPGSENDPRDHEVVNGLTSTIPVEFGNAAMVFDSEDYRRGPFDVFQISADYHQGPDGYQGTLKSTFHQESAFCGTCHDISNPLLSWDPISQTYKLNTLGQPFTDTTQMFPIERTYSEWKLSDYNSPQGVYAPQFGGNKTYVSTCQDCHMQDVTGKGGSNFGGTDDVPLRDDMPVHDLTGANTFVPQIIPQHPVFSATFNDSSRLDALNAGIDRARIMLQKAASLNVHFDKENDQLNVRVINNSGHKLPTGYVEGRRMWLQIEGYDADGNLIYISGAYDVATGELTHDPDLQIYESLQGITPDWADTLSNTYSLPITPGESFHFVLNNIVVKDNRIPPRGFDYDAFLAAGAEPRTNSQPDPTLYADGQFWDDVVYDLPADVAYGRVRLLHQVASKEYIEFLRDNNPNDTDPNNNGEILYDLWQNNGRSEPEVMVEFAFGEEIYLPITTRE